MEDMMQKNMTKDVAKSEIYQLNKLQVNDLLSLYRSNLAVEKDS